MVTACPPFHLSPFIIVLYSWSFPISLTHGFKVLYLSSVRSWSYCFSAVPSNFSFPRYQCLLFQLYVRPLFCTCGLQNFFLTFVFRSSLCSLAFPVSLTRGFKELLLTSSHSSFMVLFYFFSLLEALFFMVPLPSVSAL